jgi:hypothetical protein
MTEPIRDLKNYKVYQTPDNSNLDYDRKRDKEVKDEANLKERLRKKRDE